MIGFPELTFVSTRERRELMTMLLNAQQEKPSNTSQLPNKAAKKCNLCEKKFTLTTRRHHCRHCGHIFCSSCTSNQKAIPKLDIKGKVRVCDTCNTILSGQNASAGPSYSLKSS